MLVSRLNRQVSQVVIKRKETAELALSLGGALERAAESALKSPGNSDQRGTGRSVLPGEGGAALASRIREGGVRRNQRKECGIVAEAGGPDLTSPPPAQRRPSEGSEVAPSGPRSAKPRLNGQMMGQPCHLLSLLAFWESQSRQQAAGPGGEAEPRVSGDAQERGGGPKPNLPAQAGAIGKPFPSGALMLVNGSFSTSSETSDE